MATKTYENLGPIYLTSAKFKTLKDAGQLEVGREYKLIDWEAQEKLVPGQNITIDENNVISAVVPTTNYIELTGWDETSGWHNGGTITDAQATILTANELNYIWMNGMHRLDFRYKDDSYNLATYSANDGAKTHVIEITLSTKAWRYTHTQLQEKLIAGSNITIAADGKTISATDTVYDDTAIKASINAKQDTLVSGTNIKTVNGSSIVGSGNAEVKTYLPFPDGEIQGTLQEVVTAIKAFPTKAAGMAYLGSIRGTCTPFGYGNIECTVTFMTDSIALLEVSSSNIYPFHWEYNTYAGNYKWRSFITMPDKPDDFSSSTYVLKFVNGTATWVKES